MTRCWSPSQAWRDKKETEWGPGHRRPHPLPTSACTHRLWGPLGRTLGGWEVQQPGAAVHRGERWGSSAPGFNTRSGLSPRSRLTGWEPRGGSPREGRLGGNRAQFPAPLRGTRLPHRLDRVCELRSPLWGTQTTVPPVLCGWSCPQTSHQNGTERKPMAVVQGERPARVRRGRGVQWEHPCHRDRGLGVPSPTQEPYCTPGSAKGVWAATAVSLVQRADCPAGDGSATRPRPAMEGTWPSSSPPRFPGALRARLQHGGWPWLGDAPPGVLPKAWCQLLPHLRSPGPERGQGKA